MSTEHSAAIVLAAGASRRFGRPKLAEPVAGEPLLLRAVRVAMEGGFQPVVVVLGAHRAVLEPLLAGCAVEIVANPGWRRGVGTSLAAAAAHLVEHHPGIRGAVVFPADLPQLGAAHLVRLEAAAREAALPSAATLWDGAPLQAPAWFAREFLPALLELRGDQGARRLLRDNPSRVAGVRLPSPLPDVDRPEDLP